MNISKLNLINNNNTLLSSVFVKNSFEAQPLSHWCEIIDIEHEYDYSMHYQHICQHHQHNHKWILMINPENDLLAQLHNQGKIGSKNILKVDTTKVKVRIEHIKRALLKGNCAAVILSNTQFNDDELKLIAEHAAQGKTQCIILNKIKHIH